MSWTWGLVVLGIAGVILNNFRNRWCFAIWAVGNISWCIVDYCHGLYSQSALMGVYTLLALHGWCKWSRK